MNQKQVSVRGEVFDRLKQRATELDVPVAHLVERILAPVLYTEGKDQPAPSVDQAPTEG
jgi:hypothetical protein